MKNAKETYKYFRDNNTFYAERSIKGKGRPIVTLCSIEGDEGTAFGLSICSEKDNPCKAIGRKIANARAKDAIIHRKVSLPIVRGFESLIGRLSIKEYRRLMDHIEYTVGEGKHCFKSFFVRNKEVERKTKGILAHVTSNCLCGCNEVNDDCITNQWKKENREEKTPFLKYIEDKLDFQIEAINKELSAINICLTKMDKKIESLEESKSHIYNRVSKLEKEAERINDHTELIFEEQDSRLEMLEDTHYINKEYKKNIRERLEIIEDEMGIV